MGLAVLCFFIPAFAHAQDRLQELRDDLTGIVSDTNFSNATWAVAMQSVKTGEDLFVFNENKSLLPASCFKLLTAAEALALLGPEFRYRTEFLTTGKITDGKVKGYPAKILTGDLLIRGSGDPTFGVDSTFGYSVLWGLSSQDIHKISGRIIGDDSYFTSDVYPLGWAVEDLPYYYAPQISGLNFERNQATLTVYSGESIGDPANFDFSAEGPEFVGVDLKNIATTSGDSISAIDLSRKIGTNTITIGGKIALDGESVDQSASIENPTLHTVQAVTGMLRESGSIVTKEALTTRDLKVTYPYDKARVIAVDTSLSLSEIVKAMDKESDNMYAECLFRTVAKEIGGEGSWTKGAFIMKNFLGSLGCDTARIAISDGSGLSRMDLISAHDFVTLLRAMPDKTSMWDAFYNSLPIAGVDGTLINRMKGTAAEGNVHAKTGSMTGVRSICGYLTTRDGEQLAFSIIGNNYTASGHSANELEDRILLRLVDFSR